MAEKNDDFNELMREWQVCFSKRKQREYYFNAKSGEALWTLDEVKEHVRKALEPTTSTLSTTTATTSKATATSKTSKTTSEKSSSSSSHKKSSSSKETKDDESSKALKEKKLVPWLLIVLIRLVFKS